MRPLGYRVIGSPTDSGSVSLGSSPGTPAKALSDPSAGETAPGRFCISAWRMTPDPPNAGLQPANGVGRRWRASWGCTGPPESTTFCSRGAQGQIPPQPCHAQGQARYGPVAHRNASRQRFRLRCFCGMSRAGDGCAAGSTLVITVTGPGRSGRRGRDGLPVGPGNAAIRNRTDTPRDTQQTHVTLRCRPTGLVTHRVRCIVCACATRAESAPH